MSYINGLRNLLGQYFSFSLKTQSYHWNTKGPHFLEDHRFYGELYENTSEAIDGVAERLRMLHQNVHVNLDGLARENALGDPVSTFDRRALLEDLLKDQKLLTASINTVLHEAENNGDVVTVDFLTDRLSFHDKTSWMLEAMLA